MQQHQQPLPSVMSRQCRPSQQQYLLQPADCTNMTDVTTYRVFWSLWEACCCYRHVLQVLCSWKLVVVRAASKLMPSTHMCKRSGTGPLSEACKKICAARISGEYPRAHRCSTPPRLPAAGSATREMTASPYKAQGRTPPDKRKTSRRSVASTRLPGF